MHTKLVTASFTPAEGQKLAMILELGPVVEGQQERQYFHIDDYYLYSQPQTPDDFVSLFKPDVLSYNDYYPFGMIVPRNTERVIGDSGYRYGFQGQEKDDEIKGEGNSLNYEFRMHDPRVGRFFAPDPLEKKYPFYSSYQFSGNRVIDMVELEGLEPAQPGNAEGQHGDAVDQTAIANNNYFFSDFIGYLLGSTENNGLYKSWYWHEGAAKTTAGWYEANDYKGIVMPFAIDYAESEGWSFGTDWQSAKDLICNPDTPNDVISQSTADFLSSRTQDSGLTDLLTQIGANVINSANKALASKSTGSITPMDLDSPFFAVGIGLKGFATGEGIGYRAISAEYAESTTANGFYRSGAAGRLGGDGIYFNSTKEGALSEFYYHNPSGTPALFQVKYPISKPYLFNPPPSIYQTRAIEGTEGFNILSTPSLRAPGTMNFLIRSGEKVGKKIN